jgi:hypothetical protein
MCPEPNRALIEDEWEVFNEPVWPIHQQPVEELHIALRDGNPDRARAAIDRLWALLDRHEIDGPECLRRLLGALGDVDLNDVNPAAALYIDALVSLKTLMPLKRFPGRGPWPEEQVATRLGETMPAPSQVMSPTNRKLPATAAATSWIGRIKAFMAAGLLSQDHGAALMRKWDGARQAQRTQIAKQATTPL